ncbi:MAG: DNA mismatch repair protein MutS [Candidatus Latescibacterota bacterium]|nr:MAG: DNA mismatch repair protein MutS [Candidatus Latescibacterota bacterium]
MSERLTPLMSQYRDIKRRHPGGILFFQVGDFYETFHEDAREISRLLNIALTTRDKDRSDPVPLAGVPIHAAENYIAKLLQAGRTVVVCDQVEDTPGPSGVVKRLVTDVVTPGTTLSPATLVESENNYIVSLAGSGGSVGFAVLDVSTGEFSAGEGSRAEAERSLAAIRFREAIVPAGTSFLMELARALAPSCVVDERPPSEFERDAACEALRAHFGPDEGSCAGFSDRPRAAAAAGALLSYVKELRRSPLAHVTELRHLVTEESLILDPETLRNLEIFEPLQGNAPDTTLVRHIDRTATAMGARELRRRLRRPSRRRAVIERSLDAVSSFLADHAGLRELESRLRRFPDIERLLARITARKAGPRDLLALAEALERVPAIAETARRFDASAVADAVERLARPLEARETILRGIEPGTPAHIREGGVIRRGYREDLDRLIEESEGGKSWIARLQESERGRTGIASLKVGYNRVFGYYLEVPRSHEAKVPAEYVPRQTLVSSLRFVTSELVEREQAILAAESRRVELEREIFDEICGAVARESRAIQVAAAAIAELDVLSSLAAIALERGYCRPEMNETGDLLVTGGRHPVVELISGAGFIPNDTELRAGERTFLLITGPNMGGKSTYIRQTAIVALLAHAGSYVPAARASVGLLDRIFTRVGSSDNLARGQSTFLVEMAETAKILHQCTSSSLVVLDEIGRGTSTLDGLSIAWAVSEYLLENERRRPMTLFATHYHELTNLAERFPHVRNLRVEVREWGDEIVFLYSIREGASDRSYGIHVARLAGLPEQVIRRANEILAALEREQGGEAPPRRAEAMQPSLFDRPDAIRIALQDIEIDRITPLEALKILSDLKKLTGE